MSKKINYSSYLDRSAEVIGRPYGELARIPAWYIEAAWWCCHAALAAANWSWPDNIEQGYCAGAVGGK